MFRAQYKSQSPYESWKAIGSYGTESQAINSALYKKKRGALLVRVIDKKGSVVYSS
jgi:hypothetical protein